MIRFYSIIIRKTRYDSILFYTIMVRPKCPDGYGTRQAVGLRLPAIYFNNFSCFRRPVFGNLPPATGYRPPYGQTINGGSGIYWQKYAGSPKLR